MVQVAPAYKPPRKFWRTSKYIIPADLSALRIVGSKAPRQMSSLGELQHHPHARVKVIELGVERRPPPPPVEAVHHGNIITTEVPEFAPVHLNVALLGGACTVGRHSCLVAADDSFVSDSGYYLDYARVKSCTPLGRLSPRYWRYRWQGDLCFRSELPSERSLRGSAAVLNHAWSHNFYHWMLEIMPRISLIRDAGLDPDWYLVDHQAGYQKAALRLLGIPAEKLLQPHYALNLRADQIVRPSEPCHSAIRSAAELIKKNLQSSDGRDFERGKRIYISRRQASHRKIGNEAELESLLKAHGFETHNFESCPFEEQVRLLSSAEIIVAVHGAALANTIFAPQGTQVIEICPKRRYNIDCFPRLSFALGNHHQSILADCTRYRQVMTVDLDDVRRCLDAAGHSSTRIAA